MEFIKINQMANNQIELYTATDNRFYSYGTCICVYEYRTKQFTLSDNESHFTRTTVKWLNRFLAGHGTCYHGIKQTAKRAKLN